MPVSFELDSRLVSVNKCECVQAIRPLKNTLEYSDITDHTS